MTQRTRDWVRYFVDYSALAVFLIAYFATGRNMANATWALVAGSAVAIVVGLIVERRVAPFPLIAGGAGLLFGGASLIFDDPRILKIKPTVMNSIFAVQCSHNFKYHDFEVKSQGNALGHAVLRGAIDHSGRSIPNYHYEHLKLVCAEYERRELKNPAVIVDTNHANSMKEFREQPRIIFETLDNMRYSAALRKLIKGFMVESYIEEGAQRCDGGIYGKSVTDSCLGWADTERLLFEIADRL